MTRLETILEQAANLTPDERDHLIKLLLDRAPLAPDDDAASARRGLAAWTDSSRGEDWSPFYPKSLDSHDERNS